MKRVSAAGSRSQLDLPPVLLHAELTLLAM